MTPSLFYCTSFGYSGYFSQSFLTSARTAPNAPSFSSMIFAIRRATSLASSSLNPRVVMLGVPTYWRDFGNDTEANPRLHELIRRCDVVMPWFVGRYNQSSYEGFKARIPADKEWADANGVDYAPLCFPGFSWANMKGSSRGSIGRDGGRFFWQQLSASISAGAEMLYIAMFDEIDEGTAIFKCAKRVPVPSPGSTFVPIEPDDSSDNYLWLAGQAGRMLRGELPVSEEMPVR